jgi:hypothetical protein
MAKYELRSGSLCLLLGAFVLRRSSKTWFDNVFQVNYMNRYFRIQNYGYGARPGRRLSQTKVEGSRSCTQGSFGAMAQRGNRLKDEKTSGSSIDFHKPLTNVMDMDVILRGLRPASINRWTVLPYCSRGLGIRFCVTLILFTFSQDRRYICNLKTFLFSHVNKIEMILWWCLYYISCFTWVLRHYLLCSRRYVSHDLRLRLIISRRDIMLRRTKDSNT